MVKFVWGRVSQGAQRLPKQGYHHEMSHRAWQLNMGQTPFITNTGKRSRLLLRADGKRATSVLDRAYYKKSPKTVAIICELMSQIYRACPALITVPGR